MRGVFWNHSIEFLVWVGDNVCRLVDILSAIVKINIITPTDEIIDMRYRHQGNFSKVAFACTKY